MRKYLKAIGCFAIFVSAVSLHFREQSYKLDSLSLQNVETLAEDEEYAHISCIGVGSLDCPVSHSGVEYVLKGHQIFNWAGKGMEQCMPWKSLKSSTPGKTFKRKEVHKGNEFK